MRLACDGIVRFGAERISDGSVSERPGTAERNVCLSGGRVRKCQLCELELEYFACDGRIASDSVKV
jgi:hypothetical protein